ncbi:cell division inhibitor SepF [Geodermatophilus obscurus]|uniref:Cell division protein SepF n=1 Tax=Geodermatophilus obscurus TaxID=1861 RepID=A0A1I5FYG3_9ACTN|nr:cell division protein SepF [Geodermatophilus obscurus]SFO28792.1 cell division inhibitor SepF [Geodermatophilus obscurus]
MAGAMRKMGIYLGLVEDDDARAYDRYDARQADHHDRYDDGRYDERYDEGRYDDHRADPRGGRYDDRYAERHPADRHSAEVRGEGGYGGYDSLAGDPGYDDRYADRRYDGERFDDRGGREDGPADAEPALPRRAGATRLGLATPVSSPAPVAAAGESRVSAPSGNAGPRLGSVGGTIGGSAGSGPAGGTIGGTVGGSVGGPAAAGLAAREAVAAAEPAPAPAPQPYRITTLSPKTYNEARAIGEAFRDGSPVIMNLTELDHADARRLVDFAAGLIFGLRGNIEPVTAKVFLLSPRDVDVTAEDKARIREGGFFAKS